MKLFIACLLIHGFELPWWMYMVALVIWVVCDRIEIEENYGYLLEQIFKQISSPSMRQPRP